MQVVRVITGRGVPLRRADVDTDQIIPSDWLKRIERTGFGAGLFSEWRKDPDFVLNQDRYAGAGRRVRGRFRDFEAAALVEIGFSLGMDKLQVYGDAVRDLAADQMARRLAARAGEHEEIDRSRELAQVGVVTIAGEMLVAGAVVGDRLTVADPADRAGDCGSGRCGNQASHHSCDEDRPFHTGSSPKG